MNKLVLLRIVVLGNLALALILFVLFSMQWERITVGHLVAKVTCHWQYGPAECRDWHRR
jgi:hypothetical protein